MPEKALQNLHSKIIRDADKIDIFRVQINDKIEAGIVLSGTEIKSIRNGKANLKDCYAIIKKGELIITGNMEEITKDASLEDVFMELTESA